MVDFINIFQRHFEMNPQPSEQLSEEQRIQQIFVYARTFRKHNLILCGKKQVSPYDLACNGFVNKNFKQQEKLEQSDQSLRQVTCICRHPQCQKILKFNSFESDKQDYENEEEQIQSILINHEGSCPFNRSQTSKLRQTQLFSIAHLIFDKIIESYEQDHKKAFQSIKIDWTQVETLILQRNEPKRSLGVLLQCYKKIDPKFCLSAKKFNKSILLSIFGWKFSSSKDSSVLLKCHFCGTKVDQELSQTFDFYEGHNLWCLVRRKESQIWKLILKKYFAVLNEKKVLNSEIQPFVIPQTKRQIQEKQIREQMFEVAKPILSQIDQLLEQSLEFVKKQKQYREQQFDGEEQNENIDCTQKFENLNQISKKCQEIIKNFINSIATKRS